MPVTDSSSAGERALAVRVAWAALLVFALTAAIAFLHRLYSQKFFGATGTAQWIWARHPISSNEPVAFFATREIVLPEMRYYTRLKILGDPEYSLFLNGREIGGRRVRDENVLDVYDLTPVVKSGRNRIVVAVRAPRGVGGLIASLDLAPESENWFPTGEQWRIYRRWHPQLLLADPPGVTWEPPVLIGEPPVGRWDFAEPRFAAMASPVSGVTRPAVVIPFVGLVPKIRTTSGVAVAITERVAGTAFDFGVTKGRIRLVADRPPFLSEAVEIRFAFDRSEFDLVEWNPRAAVFAPGERSVTLPEEREFRYVLVYGKGVRAEVVR